WASPDSLTSGSLVINELVALDLTMCGKNKYIDNGKKLLTKKPISFTILIYKKTFTKIACNTGLCFS
ncbi:hypothetical protein ACEE16_08770, partial [Streptococcus suis]